MEDVSVGGVGVEREDVSVGGCGGGEGGCECGGEVVNME